MNTPDKAVADQMQLAASQRQEVLLSARVSFLFLAVIILNFGTETDSFLVEKAFVSYQDSCFTGGGGGNPIGTLGTLTFIATGT